MTCPKHASFRLLTATTRGSHGLINKEVDLVSHPVVGLALLVGYTEKFPKALGLECVCDIGKIWYLGKFSVRFFASVKLRGVVYVRGARVQQTFRPHSKH